MVLVVDQTLVMVSRSQGRVFSASAQPPQMSTTGSPCEEDGDGGTEVGARLELVGERRADRFEARLAGSVHLCHGDPLLVVGGPCGAC